MGEIVLTAKVTHVPTMLLSERPGRLFGTRQRAIDGHREIGRRARALGADTVVVLDTHWMVNAGYHVNSNKPNEDYLIPMRMTWQSDPLVVESVKYPAGHDETYTFSEKPLNVLTGNFDDSMPVSLRRQ